MKRIFYFTATTIFFIVFLIWLLLTSFWIFIFFLIGIFVVLNYFIREMAALRREKIGLTHLLGKNEEKFSNSEIEKNRISKIFMNFDEGILAIDENRKIFLANPMAKKILRIKSDNVNGMSAREFCKLSDAEFLANFFAPLSHILKERRNYKNFVIEIFAIPFVFEEKNMGNLIILRDVTRESLFEKMKNDFILFLVHQLKTSATSAKWSLKMFLMGDFGEIKKEQRNIIERLYKRNMTLISSANNLINAAKIDDGAYFYHKELADIQDIIASVAKYFQEELARKKIKFVFKKPIKRLQKIMLDKEKIEAVITNFFDNAIKYTREKGKIDVFLNSDKKNITFQIKDSGIGIPDDQKSKIFGKFFRANNANKIEVNGSGIGLFLAKKIVEDHGGSIWFDSEEDKGSSFYFTLPVE